MIKLTPWLTQTREMMKLKENLKDPSLVSHFADYNASQYMYSLIMEKQLHSKLYQTATSWAFYLSFIHDGFTFPLSFCFPQKFSPQSTGSGYE